MKKQLVNIIYSLLVLLVPLSSIALDIEKGEQLFAANCSAYHAGGRNVVVPEKSLKSDILKANGMKSVEAINYQVTNGKNAMPAFGGRLDDENIKDIAQYVLSQSNKGWE